jgi:vitamin B12 transporter
MQNLNKNVLAAAISLSSVFSALVHAQESEVETGVFDEIIITSSRIETPLRQTATSVSVITAEQIKARGSLSLIDVLRALPSISVSNSGGAGKTTTLRIRGEEGFRTITLLDGLKLSDPSITQVQPQLEHTLSTGVERVEVLRGPQGFNYGADAGGIISISTQPGSAGVHSQLDAQSGSFGTQQVATNISGGTETADVFISGARYTTAGFNIQTADTVLADKDGYENTSLHSRIGLNVTDQLRVDLVHREVSGKSEFDGCFDPASFGTAYDCDSDYDQQASRLAARYQSNGIAHQLAWSNTRTDRENFALGESSFTSRGELERLEYLGNIARIDGMNLVYGVDSEEENNNGDTRRQTGYYLEYLSNFSQNFFITAGVRQDDNDDFGTHTSYRITSAWIADLQQHGSVKLRGNYGTGFRAPSLYEGAYNSGPWASPPASLSSLVEETSTGYEAAVEYFSPQDLRFELVYFNQTVSNAIYFDLATYSGYLQDIGESESEGIELSASLPLTEHVSLTTNYTWNDARRPDGQQRQRRPKDLGNVSLSYRSADDRLSLYAFYRTSRRAVDQLGSMIFDLDNYHVIDLSGSYRFSDRIELYARIENVQDAGFEEVIGYNNARRAAYIGARVNL